HQRTGLTCWHRIPAVPNSLGNEIATFAAAQATARTMPAGGMPTAPDRHEERLDRLRTKHGSNVATSHRSRGGRLGGAADAHRRVRAPHAQARRGAPRHAAPEDRAGT